MQSPSNTDFDPVALKAFLGKRFGDAPMRLETVGGGQSNPTYFLDYGNRRLVLRKKPVGPILRGAHAVDREYRVLEALAPTGVPVPHPVLFHGGDEPLGTPFYLMERLDGRVFEDASLPGLSPGERIRTQTLRTRWLAIIAIALSSTLLALVAPMRRGQSIPLYSAPGLVYGLIYVAAHALAVRERRLLAAIPVKEPVR